MEDSIDKDHQEKFLLLHSLGTWIAPSPQIWQYYPNAEDNTLEAIQGDNTNIPEAGEPVSIPVSVVETSEGALKVNLMGGPFHMEEDTDAQSFIDFLQSWGGSLMWDGLVLPDDPSWKAHALVNNSLVCVTGIV